MAAQIVPISLVAEIDGSQYACLKARIETPANGVPQLRFAVPTCTKSTASGQSILHVVSLGGEAKVLQDWQQGTLNGELYNAGVTVTIGEQSTTYSGIIGGISISKMVNGTQLCEIAVFHKMSLLSRASAYGAAQAVGVDIRTSGTSSMTMDNFGVIATWLESTDGVRIDPRKVAPWPATRSYLSKLLDKAVRLWKAGGAKKLTYEMVVDQLSEALRYMTMFDDYTNNALDSLVLNNIPYVRTASDREVFSLTGLAGMVLSSSDYPSLGEYAWAELAQTLMHCVHATPDWNKVVCEYYSPVGTFSGKQPVNLNVDEMGVLALRTNCTNPSQSFISCVTMSGVTGIRSSGVGGSKVDTSPVIMAMWPTSTTSGTAMPKSLPKWVNSETCRPLGDAPASDRRADAEQAFKKQKLMYQDIIQRQANRTKAEIERLDQLKLSINELLTLLCRDIYESTRVEQYTASITMMTSASLTGAPLAKRVKVVANKKKFCEGYVSNIVLDLDSSGDTVSASTTYELTHVTF